MRKDDREKWELRMGTGAMMEVEVAVPLIYWCVCTGLHGIMCTVSVKVKQSLYRPIADP